MIISPEGIEKSLRLSFSAMNNENEYKTLQAGLVVVHKLGGKVARLHCDSRLTTR